VFAVPRGKASTDLLRLVGLGPLESLAWRSGARPTCWPGSTRLSDQGCDESSGRAYKTIAVITANAGTLAQSVTGCAPCSSHAGGASVATTGRARHGPTLSSRRRLRCRGDRQSFGAFRTMIVRVPALVSPRLRRSARAACAAGPAVRRLKLRLTHQVLREGETAHRGADESRHTASTGPRRDFFVAGYTTFALRHFPAPGEVQLDQVPNTVPAAATAAAVTLLSRSNRLMNSSDRWRWQRRTHDNLSLKALWTERWFRFSGHRE